MNSPVSSITAVGPLSPLDSLDLMEHGKEVEYTYTPSLRQTSAAADTSSNSDDSASFPSQSLTKQSLLFLNLKSSSLKDLPAAESNFTTTPELTSSSSVNSFDEHSEDSKALQRLYNNSNSSIATIVQRFSSSTSTLNLQERHELDSSAKMSSDIDKLATDFSTTSLSSFNGVTDSSSVGAPKRLKSSLKLPSLTRSKSMPSAKTVRFSTDLEKVKTFNEYAKPSSISLENSPEQSPPTGLYDGDTPKAFFQLNSSSFYSNSSSDSDDSEEDYFTYKNKLRSSKWKIRNSNFDLYSTVRSFTVMPVKLASLSVSDNLLRGTVEVMNYSFEKYVEIKFTTDSWNSIYLVTGSFERSLDNNRDQFKFETNLNKSVMMNSSRMLKKNSSTPMKVELCVKYIAGGSSVYYDNNHSNNYKFELMNQSCENKKLRNKTHHTRSPSIDSNFVTAKINAPPKVMSTGRYFSDETDYFNNSPTKMRWLNTNFQSSFTTSSPSSTNSSSNVSTSKSSANTSSETLSKSISNKSLSNTPQSYSDLLQKYCFFKSEDPQGLDPESVFIR